MKRIIRWKRDKVSKRALHRGSRSGSIKVDVLRELTEERKARRQSLYTRQNPYSNSNGLCVRILRKETKYKERWQGRPSDPNTVTVARWLRIPNKAGVMM